MNIPTVILRGIIKYMYSYKKSKYFLNFLIILDYFFCNIKKNFTLVKNLLLGRKSLTSEASQTFPSVKTYRDK